VARRALVTGGAGYLGRAVVDALRARGYDVRIFDVGDASPAPAGVEVVRGDIRDGRAVRDAARRVDVIHHAVAAVPLAKDARLFESVNVGGTRNVLDAARAESVPKTVIVSSSAVFGIPLRNPVDATVSPRPQEAYGRAKLRAERLAATYVDAGLDVTILRPRTIVGGDRLGIFHILFELVRRGRPIYVLGKGENRYQLVHVGDFADACVRGGEHAGSATFNVGAARFGTMRELLGALVAHARTGSRVISLPMRAAESAMRLASFLRLSPLAPYHSLMYGREMYFDTTPIQTVLGWRSTRSNDEMLIESYDYYLAHRADLLGLRGASRHRAPTRFGLLRLLELVP
jgi:nucleoside-diphosphate-sugar epimerase